MNYKEILKLKIKTESLFKEKLKEIKKCDNRYKFNEIIAEAEILAKDVAIVKRELIRYNAKTLDEDPIKQESAKHYLEIFKHDLLKEIRQAIMQVENAPFYKWRGVKKCSKEKEIKVIDQKIKAIDKEMDQFNKAEFDSEELNKLSSRYI